MKSKNIILILFLFCTSLCFAQDKLFEKYADMDNVTSVFISKKMFDMIPNIESGGLNLMNLKGKINNLQIVTSDKQELREQMKKEFGSIISRSHEELMRGMSTWGTAMTRYHPGRRPHQRDGYAGRHRFGLCGHPDNRQIHPTRHTGRSQQLRKEKVTNVTGKTGSISPDP